MKVGDKVLLDGYRRKCFEGMNRQEFDDRFDDSDCELFDRFEKVESEAEGYICGKRNLNTIYRVYPAEERDTLGIPTDNNAENELMIHMDQPKAFYMVAVNLSTIRYVLPEDIRKDE